VAYSKLIRDGMSFSILVAIFLFYMKSAIQRRKVDIFLESIFKKSLVLNKNIGSTFLSYELCLAG